MGPASSRHHSAATVATTAGTVALLLLWVSPTVIAAEEKVEEKVEEKAQAEAQAEAHKRPEAQPEAPSSSANVETTPAGAAAPSVAAAAAADAAPATGGSASPVLPPSAYPEPQIRGLKYGSLWLTFHGLQWPYLPAGPDGKARFTFGLSGWGWIDTSYEKFRPWSAMGSNDGSRQTYWKQQGRMLARLTPTYSVADWFVQGQVELVGTGDQTIGRVDTGGADTDDLWIRVGKWNKWDVQVGRYEGWEVFHLGMGLDQNTFERKGAVGQADQPGIAYYGLTDNQFRPQGPVGNLAVHVYPLPFFRVEALGVVGSLTNPVYGTRPVAVLDLGWLKLKAGVEYQKIVGLSPTDRTEITSKGVGGAVQFVLAPHVEFGLNLAQGTVWSVDNKGILNQQGSLTRTSFGGFANVSNGSARHPALLGVGAMVTHNVDQNNTYRDGVVDDYWLFQSYVALQFLLVDQLHVKAVGGYSRGHWAEPGGIVFDDEVYSARLRFAYYF